MSELTKKYIAELDDGIRDLFESERWTGYLSFLSRFHRYSVNNTLAIYAQRPDATLVASFTDWKRMGRSIKKDEHGMRIIAKHETKETDEATGEEKRRIGFHLAHCFDVSQTAGDALPENPCQTHCGPMLTATMPCWPLCVTYLRHRSRSRLFNPQRTGTTCLTMTRSSSKPAYLRHKP